MRVTHTINTAEHRGWQAVRARSWVTADTYRLLTYWTMLAPVQSVLHTVLKPDKTPASGMGRAFNQALKAADSPPVPWAARVFLPQNVA